MAIAYDSQSHSVVNPGSSLTFSHTCTGSNLLLVVSVIQNSGSDTVTGVTYNSVSMTRVDIADTTGAPFYLYYLNAPATGTHNVVVSSSTGANLLAATSVSYTGCDQTSSVINAHGVQTTPRPATSGAVSLTSSVDNCWMVAGYSANINSTYVAGANTTLRTATGQEYIGICDSNAVISPAGALTLNTTWTGSNNWAMLGAMIKPATPTTSIKTIDGLVVASVKTVNGLAIASVKNFNGLT